jgi:hypothetical protein
MSMELQHAHESKRCRCSGRERFWADERDCAPDLEVVECRSPLMHGLTRPLAPVAVPAQIPMACQGSNGDVQPQA